MKTYEMFFFVTWETISTSVHLHHQRIESVSGSCVLNELKALKLEMLQNEYSNKTFEILTCNMINNTSVNLPVQNSDSKILPLNLSDSLKHDRGRHINNGK